MPGVPTAVFLLTVQEVNKTVACGYLTTIDAVSVVPVGATRKEIWDLLAVKSDGSVTIFTHGLQELPIVLGVAQAGNTGSAEKNPLVPVIGITSIKSACVSSVTLLCAGGEAYSGRFDMLPRDRLVNQALQSLSLVIPTKDAFTIHLEFLRTWSLRNFSTSSNLEFHALTYALTKMLDLGLSYPANRYASHSADWEQFFSLRVNVRNFQDDPALQHLSLPAHLKSQQFSLVAVKPNPLLAPVLYALHMLAEDLRLVVHRHDSLTLLVPLVCQIAHIIRPEWADYWKRLCPNVMPVWPSPSTTRT
jgi:anaphase-promoting complex subunit 1